MPMLDARDADHENARILLDEVQQALARGTTHYNKAGELLATPLAIVECLLHEGGVTFVPAGMDVECDDAC